MDQANNDNNRRLRERVGIIDADDLSGMIGVSVKTLQVWRRTGEGPRFILINRHAFYRLNDVEDWINDVAERAAREQAMALERGETLEEFEEAVQELGIVLERGTENVAA